MKVKGLKLIETAGSRGFLIPVQYTQERMDKGLIVGTEYDLEITPHQEESL